MTIALLKIIISKPVSLKYLFLFELKYCISLIKSKPLNILIHKGNFSLKSKSGLYSLVLDSSFNGSLNLCFFVRSVRFSFSSLSDSFRSSLFISLIFSATYLSYPLGIKIILTIPPISFIPNKTPNIIRTTFLISDVLRLIRLLRFLGPESILLSSKN